MNGGKPYLVVWSVFLLLSGYFAVFAFGDDAGRGMAAERRLSGHLQTMAKMRGWRTLDVGTFDRKGGNAGIRGGLLLFSFGYQEPEWVYKAPEDQEIFFAALSPDGHQVAFWQSPAFGGRGVSSFCMLKLGEDRPTKIAEFAVPGIGICWSRDGRKMIFSAGQDSKSEVVSAYIFDTTAKPAEALTKLNLSWKQRDAVILSQGWSPDESELVYTVSDKSGRRVLIYNLATRTSRTIAKGDAPAWSPAGDWIAYETGGYNAGSLRLVSPDGRKHETLLQDPTARKDYIRGPILWSPDGAFLLFSRTLAPDPVGQLPHVMEMSTRREEELPVDSVGGIYGGSLSWAGKDFSN